MRPFDRIRILLAFLLILTGMAGFVTAGVARAALGPVTESGTGRFSGLKVTVSQTADLVDQTVHVTWTGGTPTVGNSPRFGADYIQLMQCWGDPTTGPTPQQCEFGASGDQRGGQTPTNLRQLQNDVQDPKLVYPLDPNTYPGGDLPFTAVDGTTVEGTPLGGDKGLAGYNTYFNQATTNEIPFGMTASDGTGDAYFETLTAREAPGLGCGTAEVSAGVKTGQPCFLVVIPRDTREVDGSTRTGRQLNTLISSPLSPTNWADRIVFKLDFQPLGDVCPLGAQERLTTGDDQVGPAALSWQAELCLTGTKTLYGYTVNTDDVARQGLHTADTADPQLNYISQPLPQAQYPKGGLPVYAPVALSGLAIAFDIESQSSKPGGDPTDGKRITALNLTPRLVAKLLTESYKWATIESDPIVTGALKNNPTDMTHDPEFLKDNPQFAAQALHDGLPDALVPQFDWDSANLLWKWLLGDKAAAAFLTGTPDENGMVVNPLYSAVTWPVSSYPKLQKYCATQEIPGALPICIQDERPYAADTTASARAALHGDTLAKANWDSTAIPPGFTASPPQAAGLRSILAVTTTAEAAQFGLPVASLMNASGHFVKPDAAGLTASATSMTSPDQLPEPNPASGDPAAYPLTTLTYASTVPALIDKQEAADYAALIDYSVGAGQVPGVQPGQLPAGYVPLPAAQVSAAQSAAQQIVALAATGLNPGGATSGATGASGSATTSPSALQVGVVVPTHTTTRGPTSTAPRPTGGTGGEGSGGGVVPPTGTITAPKHPVTTGAIITPSPSRPKAKAALVGSIPVGAVRYLMLVVLIVGGVALAAGPLLRWHVARRAGGPARAAGPAS